MNGQVRRLRSFYVFGKSQATSGLYISVRIGLFATAVLRFPHVLPEQGDELFRAEALVALHVANDSDLASRGAVGKCFRYNSGAVFGAEGDLWQD